MATLVKEPFHCTFIHIPKTGGNSVTNWLRENFDIQVSKGKQHAKVPQAQNILGDLGLTYCIVRNPWDYAVSYYNFLIYLSKAYIEEAEQDPNLIIKKPNKYNIEQNKLRLLELEKGFDVWLANMGRPAQIKWAGSCDHVMKLENINEDFKFIQDKLNCHKPLGVANKTPDRDPDYRKYYTSQQSIDIVARKYALDIKEFGYDF